MIGWLLVGAAITGFTDSAWTNRDWKILEAKVRWGVAHRLDTLPVGTVIARLGATFVGTKYTPSTLEGPGPERVVINLRELDCVTFVENTLALVRFIRQDGVALLGRPAAARARYLGYLRDLRYRGGALGGYDSRLHYFSEWLDDNQRRGHLTLITDRLGGVVDSGRIDFMSTHRTAYRQLADSAVWDRIRSIEAKLATLPPRLYLPKERIAAVADSIQDGDLIAATSTVAGLDVAHTGFAFRQNGRLLLLHAPLVGKSVEISELPLAERILKIKSQDGIMVARPAL